MNSLNPSAVAASDYDRSGLLWRAALVLLVFLLGCYDLSDGDIWWHLRTGQLIWERGETPRTDWYTYTNPEAEWIDLHWGFQLAAAALWAAGGSAALILAKSVLGAAAIGLCLTIDRKSWPAWQTAACWLAPILVFAGRFYERPETVTLFLLAATLAILHHAADHPRLRWCLPLVQLVWVNVQGLFILQHVVLACFLVDAVVSRWRRRTAEKTDRPAPWKSWLAVTAATAAASLVNPYGLRGAMFPLTLFQRLQGPDRAFYQQFSDELRGYDNLLAQAGTAGIATNTTALLAMLVAVLIVLSFVLRLAQGRFSLYRALLFGLFAYLAWQMVRNGPLLAVVGGVVLRLNLGEFVAAAQTRLSAAEGEAGARPVRDRGRLARRLTAALLALLILSIPSGLYYRVRQFRPPRRFHFGQAAWYAHSAVQFLNRPGFPDTIYAAHHGLAALCIYHLAPQRRLHSDARLELHTRETLESYLAVMRQLAAGDPAAEAELVDHVAPGPDGLRQLPALVFNNFLLLRLSMEEPGLLQGILRSGRWRCVYCDTKPDRVDSDPTAVYDGATIFLAEERAQQLGLPPVDTSLLETLAAALRAARGEL